MNQREIKVKEAEVKLPAEMTENRIGVDSSKTSTKRCGIIEAYAANTCKGVD
jgi:hypothetical protein